MAPAIPFRFPGIEEDVTRLGGLLGQAIASTGWAPPRQAVALNLACGRADETGTLLAALAPGGAPLHYLGIDLRDAEIREARARWSPVAGPAQQLEFRCGDASRVDRLRELPPADFVFIRHQNFWTDIPVWTRLLRHALAHLHDEGVLVITSYFDREHELASACLTQCGARRRADLIHPASRPLPDAPGKSVDRRLAVFSRAS